MRRQVPSVLELTEPCLQVHEPNAGRLRSRVTFPEIDARLIVSHSVGRPCTDSYSTRWRQLSHFWTGCANLDIPLSVSSFLMSLSR